MARRVDAALLGPKKGIQGREGMTKLRMIVSLMALVAISSVAGPSAAQANPLLSGYGGPGQGNQAILGSALLNGPGGGGSGGGSSGAPDLTASSSPDSTSKGAGARVGAGVAGPGGSTAAGHVSATGRPGKRGSSGRKSTGTAPTAEAGGQGDTAHASSDAFSAYPASEQSAGGGGILGLTGEDLLYILLVLGVLALTGVLTRHLTRGAGIDGGKTS
jgi:hypothetical protein